MCRWLVILVTTLLLICSADAQTSSFGGRLTPPVFGATSGLGKPESRPSFSDPLVAKRHLTPAGANCISTFAFSQAQIINKNVYDHILTINNGCGQPIKVRACYYDTQDCITAAIPPYKREQKILGVFPLRDFRFEIREYGD